MTCSQLRRIIKENKRLVISNQRAHTLYEIRFLTDLGGEDFICAGSTVSGLMVWLRVDEVAEALTQGRLELWNDDQRFQ